MGQSDFLASSLFHGRQQSRPVDVVTHDHHLVRGGSSAGATKHRPSARDHRRRGLERSKPGTRERRRRGEDDGRTSELLQLRAIGGSGFGQNDPGFAVGIVHLLDGAVTKDRVFRTAIGGEGGEETLGLAQAVGSDDDIPAGTEVPGHRFAELPGDDFGIGPAIQGQTERAFADEAMAANGFEGQTSGIGESGVVAAEDPDASLDLNPDLTGAQDVAGGVEGDQGIADPAALSSRDALDGRPSPSDPSLEDSNPVGGGQNVPGAPPCVICVAVGDDRVLDRTPGIHVKSARGAEEPLRGSNQEVMIGLRIRHHRRCTKVSSGLPFAFGEDRVIDSPLWMLSDQSFSWLSILADSTATGDGRWWRFLGRLHPLMVHFPIGLAIAAAAVEFVNILRRRHEASPFAFTATGFAAIAACFASWFGWLNADFENATLDNTLFLHRWLGIISAAGLVVVFLAGWAGRSGVRLRALNGYRWGLIVCAILVGVGAHFGGSMVYGTGYLTKVIFPPVKAEAAPVESAPAAPTVPPAPTAVVDPKGTEAPVGVEAEATEVVTPTEKSEDSPARIVDDGNARTVSFVRDVLPILDARCVECHGPDKVKGSLRMDTAAELFSGDPEWWSVMPGKPDESLLLERVLLPADDPDAMPPKGDRLTSAQIDTIRIWISEGASHGDAATTSVAPVISTEKSEPANAVEAAPEPAPIDQAVISAAVAALRDRSVVVMRISQADREYELNASLVKPPFADEDLARLDGLQPLLAWADLGRSALTDAGLEPLREYQNLTRLSLDNTEIGDAAVDVLLALPKLERINLYGSKLTDAGLARLAAHPGLDRIYCANSAVTPVGVAAARAANPGLDVIGPEASADDSVEAGE